MYIVISCNHLLACHNIIRFIMRTGIPRRFLYVTWSYCFTYQLEGRPIRMSLSPTSGKNLHTKPRAITYCDSSCLSQLLLDLISLRLTLIVNNYAKQKHTCCQRLGEVLFPWLQGCLVKYFCLGYRRISQSIRFHFLPYANCFLYCNIACYFIIL